MKYDEYMDKECIQFCDALNELPGVTTFESCCGHLQRQYVVYLYTDNPYSMAVIARSFDRRYLPTKILWKTTIETIDVERTPQFCIGIYSEEPFKDYNTMMQDVSKVVESIKYWKQPEFYDYFKFNKYSEGMEVVKDRTNDKHITTKCGYCCTVFEYDASELEEEEVRDMRGYHYYYYIKCPICGNRILVNALI